MATGQRALYETEGEFEDELEFEDEGEYLGTAARDVGTLVGIGQREYEGEDEGEYEAEYEGEYESEYEAEYEDEFEDEDFGGVPAGGAAQGEYEGEYEDEEFLRLAARAGRRWLRRAAPTLRRVARVAAPIVGTAVGGPLGATVGRAAVAAALPDGDGKAADNGAAPPGSDTEFEAEYEAEYEDEFELEYEAEDEGEFEDEYEATAPPSPNRALAELMAAVAARATSEAEAEAMIGAATVSSLSPGERAKLDQVLANLVRGSAALVRILWRDPTTRPAIRTVPSVVRGTARTLVRHAGPGRPVTPRLAARVMASQTRRVLGRPATTQRALGANARGTAVAAHRARPVVRGGDAAAFADEPRPIRGSRRGMPSRRDQRQRRRQARWAQVQARRRAMPDDDGWIPPRAPRAARQRPSAARY